MEDKSSPRRSAPSSESDNPLLRPTAALAMWGPVLAGAASANGKMYEGLATLGTEWLDFLNRRLKEDLKLPQQLNGCQSAEEVGDVYVAFWQRAADDYQKELTVMVSLGSQLVSNSVAAAQSRLEEAA